MKWFWKILCIVLINYGIQTIGGLVGGIIIGILTAFGLPLNNIVVMAIAKDVLVIAVTILSAIITIYFIKKSLKVNVFEYFDFKNIDYKTAALCAIVGLCYSPVLEIIIGPIVHNLLGIPAKAQNFGATTMIALIINVVVLAPILEELIFRAGMIETARRETSVKSAVIASSVVFGILHFTDLSIVLNTMLAGFLIGVVYVKTGNGAYSIIIHFVNNLFATVLLLTPDSDFLNKLLVMEINGVSHPSIAFAAICAVGLVASATLLFKRLNANKQQETAGIKSEITSL